MAKSLEQHPLILPGEYNGLWSAYYVRIMFHNGTESEPIKLELGVKGRNCKCKVTVDDDGWVYANA